ncbi:beta-galactosidase [Anaerocolumna sedimenticola]|uniref:Beta-galactosidase n=1 Tax=Anaerocolumna sedimenticola TaxID=2696063 RepID=A0A6P1TH16_9FIRM|nr:beta-galactosidase [Anaerocolumna sedimenticola]QHQ59597.1 beta-galactosidase [Anaerocolumna sedimenticola]
MKKTFKRILYGGDYNPNQWPREVWNEDIRLFRKAGINSATINVFSWAKIQPSENEYYFDELDEIIEMLSRENYDIVLATSTAALPAWMFKKYPEVARTDFDGHHHKFGQRHNACPNSPIYQKFAGRLAEKLAERYGSNEHVTCWHVNNEYGGECFCENCEKAFRVWLKDKYKTIEALNQAWNLEFWGHTVYDWDEIVLPNALSEGIDYERTAFAGMSIDYRRFNSDSMLNNFKMERDAIRSFDPHTPITTNLMGTYKNLDYFKWAKEMDIVSWDSYPAYDTPWSMVAMRHDLMRGLKGQPFMLMEQTPSQQNWQPYNSLKKPGQMRAQSYQTMAHGADTIQFFQLRRSAGACEKFHGAVIEHAGTENTRVFREVSRLGEELKTLGDRLLGAENPAQVGILFDWDNYWSLEYTSGPNKDLKYVDQIHQYYRYFYEKNIPVDMIPADADFSKYKAVIAPVLYMMKDGMQQALEDYVKNGGTLVTGFMSGIVDQSDNVHLGGYPGPLRELAGIWVEEIDALAPEQSNTLRFTDGTEGVCRLLCDIIHLEGAVSIADYTSNFYAASPAVTKNSFGQGTVYYVGTQLEQNALGKVLNLVMASADVKPVIDETTKLEITCRTISNQCYYFIINLTGETLSIPHIFTGKEDILTGNVLTSQTTFAPYDVALVCEEKK